MNRPFSRWWRGGRWLDPPMLLVGLFFAGVWFLWPTASVEPAPAEAASGVPAPMRVQALSEAESVLDASRRPDAFVGRSDGAFAMDGLGAELPGWLDVPSLPLIAVSEPSADPWWLPPRPPAPDRVLADEALESLLRHAALEPFHVASDASLSARERVASTSLVVVVSASLRAAGFSVPERALALCVRSDFPWEVTVEVTVAHGVVKDVLVLAGNKEPGINHGVVRAVSMCAVQRDARGHVTFSWPGRVMPKDAPQP